MVRFACSRFAAFVDQDEIETIMEEEREGKIVGGEVMAATTNMSPRSKDKGKKIIKEKDRSSEDVILSVSHPNLTVKIKHLGKEAPEGKLKDRLGFAEEDKRQEFEGYNKQIGGLAH